MTYLYCKKKNAQLVRPKHSSLSQHSLSIYPRCTKASFLFNMSDAWFADRIAPDGNEEDGCHPQEAAALVEYLRSQTTTAQEAARAITLTIEADLEDGIKSQSDLDCKLCSLWSLLIEALKDLPNQRVKIVQLLQTIQTLPPSLVAGPIEWSDLPSFGHL